MAIDYFVGPGTPTLAGVCGTCGRRRHRVPVVVALPRGSTEVGSFETCTRCDARHPVKRERVIRPADEA